MTALPIPLRDSSPENGREAIASEIRALMGRRRVSQTRLAAHLGISQSALSRRLNGDQPFDADELFKMLAFLGVVALELRSDYTAATAKTPGANPDTISLTAERAKRQVSARLRGARRARVA